MNTVANLYDELQMSILQDPIVSQRSNNTTTNVTTDSVVLDQSSIYPAQGLGTSIATLTPQASTFLNTTSTSTNSLINRTNSLSNSIQNFVNLLPNNNNQSQTSIDLTSMSSISHINFSPSHTMGSVPVAPTTQQNNHNNPLILLQVLRTALLDVSTSVTNALTINPSTTAGMNNTINTTVVNTEPKITTTEITPKAVLELQSPSSNSSSINNPSLLTSKSNIEYSDDFTKNSTSGASLSLSSTVQGIPTLPPPPFPPPPIIPVAGPGIILPPPPPLPTLPGSNTNNFSINNLPPPPPPTSAPPPGQPRIIAVRSRSNSHSNNYINPTLTVLPTVSNNNNSAVQPIANTNGGEILEEINIGNTS